MLTKQKKHLYTYKVKKKKFNKIKRNSQLIITGTGTACAQFTFLSGSAV